MIDISQKLKKAGADLILICTNTMHKVAAVIQENIKIPLLHIVDTAAEAVKSKNMDKVGLLGTKFTMEQDFYKKRLYEKHDIKVIIPEPEARGIIHNIIYKELISGIIKKESREKFKHIIKNLQAQKAEGVILGCTEIPLLIKEEHSPLPVFDTTDLHVQKAVEFALE